MKKKYGLLINGKWVYTNQELKVKNPFNNNTISSISVVGRKEIKNSIDSASEAFLQWSKTSAKQRSNILKKFYDLVIKNKNQLSKIITLESGKPLKESKVEVEYGASFIEWSAEQALRTSGEIFESPENEKKMFIIKQPVGVVAAITPWNFPLAMVTRKVAAAVASGCSIILKPSELTPITALELGMLSIEAGFPPGVFNIINGDASIIGNIFCQNKTVRKITFTGSTNVGKLLMQNSSSTVKNLTLELGGNAPFIVFEDADIEKAIDGFILAKFRNAGQTCISANRLFVHEQIFEKFINILISRVKKLKIGNGLLNNDIGPLISKKAIEKVESHLKDASNKGAKILLGGKKHFLKGLFFEPTIITHIKKNMKVFSEENFGPIIPIISFKKIDEILQKSNDTTYGLAAYFYSKDSSKIWKLINNLDYGMIGINSGKISTYLNAFGGFKESGLGREGSTQCLEPFLETKFITWNI